MKPVEREDKALRFNNRLREILIDTKLEMPRPGIKMLRRTHLVERLAAVKNNPLCVITGPAASGKTSLVSQWLVEERRRAAWYSLDEFDNDSDRFFRYFLASLSRLDDALERKLTPVLRRQKRIQGEVIISYILDALKLLPGHSFFVLDDYHMICEDEVHRSLAFFLEHIPPRFHFILISRYEIPFPISRLKVRNKMIQISAPEMKFTDEETALFFTEILPLELSAHQLRELTLCMDGWVGGLLLFGLSFQAKQIPEGVATVMSRACGQTADYMIEEVLNRQPPGTREFLTTTALLDRFNADICKAVTGMADSARILDRTRRDNLFLSPLDDTQSWYRYHHLFSEAVRRHVQTAAPGLFQQVNEKASRWFAQNGYFEDAFHHAFASGDMAFFADMLEDYLMILYERYELASFQRWFNLLPDWMPAERGLLRLYRIRYKVETLDLTDIEAELADIEDHRDDLLGSYCESKKILCNDYLESFKRLLPYWIKPVRVDVQALKADLNCVPRSHRTFASVVSTLIPATYLYQGQINLAGAALKEIAPSIFSSENLLARMAWFRLTAHVERLQGHLHRSESVLGEALGFFHSHGLTGTELTFIPNLLQAWIHYLRNDLERAAESVSAALGYVEESKFLLEIMEGNTLMAAICSAQGNGETAYRYIEKVQLAARTIGTPDLIAIADGGCARLFLRHGEFQKAYDWINQQKSCHTETYSIHYIQERLVFSEMLYARGRYREALPILNSLRTQSMVQGVMEAVLSADILLSAVFYALKDRSGAKAAMKRALPYYLTEGYIRPFAEHRDAIWPVITEIVVSDGGHIQPDDFSDLLQACNVNQKLPRRPLSHGGAHGLTPREMEILELLVAGYTYREMAQRSFVSYETVKTHIRHIYAKLKVTSRLEAIRWGEQSGIFINPSKL